MRNVVGSLFIIKFKKVVNKTNIICFLGKNGSFINPAIVNMIYFSFCLLSFPIFHIYYYIILISYSDYNIL